MAVIVAQKRFVRLTAVELVEFVKERMGSLSWDDFDICNIDVKRDGNLLVHATLELRLKEAEDNG